jgi:hypothetical protein
MSVIKIKEYLYDKIWNSSLTLTKLFFETKMK